MASPVLGFDTSGSWCSAAVLRGQEVFARRLDVGNAHSDHLLDMIDAVLTEAGIGLVECATIAFSAGPGSFTGLRVACAVAQGLAFGAGIPVAAIGTLDAIAQSVVADGCGGCTILVAQDARMHEIYWTLLAVDDDALRTVIGPQLSTPLLLRETLLASGRRMPIDTGCGNAWTLYADGLDGLVERVVHRSSADAVDVSRLGRRALDEGRLIDAQDAAPLYIRNDVALTSAQRALRTRVPVDAR